MRVSMFKQSLLLSAVFIASSIRVSVAHYSFAAEFDADTRISVAGVIVEVRYRNPHVQYFIETDSGERWNVQAQNVPSLRRRGWTPDTLQQGDRITVNGFAGRNGAQKVYVESILAPTGATLSMYADDGKSEADTSTPEPVEAVNIDASNIAQDILGTWAFDIDKTLPGAPLQLDFSRTDDGIQAVLDNEVVDLTLGRDTFTIDLNRENFGGFPTQLRLSGALENDEIRGEVALVAGYTSVPALDASTFRATRADPGQWDRSTRKAMSPVDLTGVWNRVISLGPLGRTNPHLNAAGRARHAEYQKGLYDPTLRCMSTGIMRRYAEPGLFEIVASTNRLTFLYANGSDIRRVWFDREQHSTTRPHDIMGESLGSWDGSTLVIETRNLTETVLTHNVEPISSEATIIERYWLDENGELIKEATLIDPTYYERPVVRRTQWQRADGQEMIYAPCDPDSFYRGMQLDNALDAYFENQPAQAQE